MLYRTSEGWKGKGQVSPWDGILIPASTGRIGAYITAGEDGVVGLLIVSLKLTMSAIPVVVDDRHIIYDDTTTLTKSIGILARTTRDHKLLPAILVIQGTHLGVILPIDRRRETFIGVKSYREDVEDMRLRLVTRAHLGLTQGVYIRGAGCTCQRGLATSREIYLYLRLREALWAEGKDRGSKDLVLNP